MVTGYLPPLGTATVVVFMVGGAITILKNMSSSMGRIISHIMENKACLKPPITNHFFVVVAAAADFYTWIRQQLCC